MESYNPFSLKGKTILVTGASSGIGRGIAITCSRMGASLYLNGRNVERLEATLKELQGEGHCLVPGDITKQDDRERVVEQLPALDGIVHCAGILIRKICKQMELEEVDSLMTTNINSPILLQAAILSNKKLKKGASIVFIASVAPYVPTVGNALYSASKGAVIAFANCMSIELAPRNIRVNCVCPGMVATELITNGGFTEEELLADTQKYPLKRYGTPEDVANAVVFLLSDASSWITGTSIKVTGGLTY